MQWWAFATRQRAARQTSTITSRTGGYAALPCWRKAATHAPGSAASLLWATIPHWAAAPPWWWTTEKPHHNRTHNQHVGFYHFWHINQSRRQYARSDKFESNVLTQQCKLKRRPVAQTPAARQASAAFAMAPWGLGTRTWSTANNNK